MVPPWQFFCRRPKMAGGSLKTKETPAPPTRKLFKNKNKILNKHRGSKAKKVWIRGDTKRAVNQQTRSEIPKFEFRIYSESTYGTSIIPWAGMQSRITLAQLPGKASGDHLLLRSTSRFCKRSNFGSHQLFADDRPNSTPEKFKLITANTTFKYNT